MGDCAQVLYRWRGRYVWFNGALVSWHGPYRDAHELVREYFSSLQSSASEVLEVSGSESETWLAVSAESSGVGSVAFELHGTPTVLTRHADGSVKWHEAAEGTVCRDLVVRNGRWRAVA